MKKQIYLHILTLCFTLIVITIIIYLAEKNKILFYEWYRSLYIIPIIWFGLLYGKIGSVSVAIGVTTLYLPILMKDVQKFGFGQTQVSLLFSIVGINIIGILIGHFAGGERRLRKRSELLSDISLKFRSLFDEDLIYENLLSELVGMVECEEGILCLRENNNLILKTIAGAQFTEPVELDKSNSCIDTENILHKVFEKGEPLISNGVIEDERFITTSNTIKNVVVIPIKIKDEIVGVVGLANKKGDALFSKDDLNLSQTIIQSAVASVENLRLFEEKTKIKIKYAKQVLENYNLMQERLRREKKIYLDTIKALASAMEAKDPYTQGHSERVTEYSLAIAKELNLSEDDMEILEYASLLHDVGKIGIRDAILLKPTNLTDDEFNIVKKHPKVGIDILEAIEFLQDKLPAIIHHHERYDGSGYPDGISADEIPLFARIIGVADSFDAMTSHRAYRKEMDKDTALEEIKRNSGTQFDPKVVSAFIKVFEREFAKDFERRQQEYLEQEKFFE